MPEKSSKKTRTCFFFRNPNANLEVLVHECLVSILIQKWWSGWKNKKVPRIQSIQLLTKWFLNEIPNFLCPSNEVLMKKTSWNFATFLSKFKFLKGNPDPHRMILPCQGFNRVASTTHLSSGRSSSWRLQADPMFELVGKTHQLGGFGATSDLETIFCTCCWWWVLYSGLQPNKQTAWKSLYLNLEPQRTIFLMDGNGDFQPFPM